MNLIRQPLNLTAEIAGILKTVVNEGDTLPIGAVVASIEEHGMLHQLPKRPMNRQHSLNPKLLQMPRHQPRLMLILETPADAPDAVNTSPLEVKVPTVGESITEVTLSRWIKKDGDSIVMDEAIAELESDKATFELTAEKAGVLKTLAKEGDVLPIGAVVCTIAGSGTSAFTMHQCLLRLHLLSRQIFLPQTAKLQLTHPAFHHRLLQKF